MEHMEQQAPQQARHAAPSDKHRRLPVDKHFITAAFFVLFIFFFGVMTFTVGFDAEEAVYEPETADESFWDNLSGIRDSFTNAYNEAVYARPLFIDCFGAVELAVRRTLIDPNQWDTIVKNSLGQLQYISKKITMAPYRDAVVEFNAYLEERGIAFSFINTPSKKLPDSSKLPVGVEDYTNSNANRLLSGLRENGIDVMDLRDEMTAAGMLSEDYFFISDHHWTPEAAFWAAGVVMEKLAIDDPEHFRYDPALYDLENYTCEVFEDFFLGALGKRVGRFYTTVDDLTLITPKFETELSVEILKTGGKVTARAGDFRKAFILDDLLEPSGWELSRYNIYTGQDFPLFSVHNEDPNATGRLLVIKDSFVRPMAPFMALGMKDFAMLDLRHWEGNLYEYIEEYQPDAVLMICNQSNYFDKDCFNFDKNIAAETEEP